jgi:hypothetical protein
MRCWRFCDRHSDSHGGWYWTEEAMLLLAEAATLRGAAWGGALALYLAASSLLEPLRLEVDAPAVSQVLLPWRFGRVLWGHCLPVAAVLIAAGLATVLGG